ncbi:hypothetical protein HPB52_018253 [Rhipicephalus sanguineus]|uniref:Uncharacterized protein n=1 Tax=Rhipicephalus sanguineus TaxID=34632 RepID=A0A9D4PED5_RHISA|nr:hypothetical protein HPB52_018253 [Rhipicephalus sanguineus]
MERLQTKRSLARVDLQKVSDELMLLKTTDDLEQEHEDRIAEIRAELEVIAKDLKHQDALIDPHVTDDDFAEERAVPCGSTRRSLHEHLTQLLNLQTVKRLDDVNALRRLHDNVQRNVAGLKNLGVQPDTYGAMLCAGLFRVLPTEWAVEFHKTHATDKDVLDSSTLDAVLGSLRLELDSRERAHAGNTQAPHEPAKSRPPNDQHPDYIKGKGSAASLKAASTVCCSTVAVLRTGVVEPASRLSNELQAFWALESLGISTKDGPSGNDEHVRHDFVPSLSFVNGSYEASLPWKPLERPLETNEVVADVPAEIVHEKRRLTKTAVGSVSATAPPLLIDIERFRDLNRLLRVTSWARRFTHNCKHGARRRNGALGDEEIREAWDLLTRQVQREAFGGARSNQQVTCRFATWCCYMMTFTHVIRGRLAGLLKLFRDAMDAPAPA